MNLVAHTCPTNQWEAEAFARQVDHDEAQEVRIAAAYDAPIDRAFIREAVVRSILTFAIPAGNA